MLLYKRVQHLIKELPNIITVTYCQSRIINRKAALLKAAIGEYISMY